MTAAGSPLEVLFVGVKQELVALHQHLSDAAVADESKSGILPQQALASEGEVQVCVRA